MALIVKIEKKEINPAIPEYKEVRYKKPLRGYFSDLEKDADIWDYENETLDEHCYRRNRIRTHLEKTVDIFTDDESFKFIEEMMSLSNEAIIQIVDRKAKIAFQKISEREKKGKVDIGLVKAVLEHM